MDTVRSVPIKNTAADDYEGGFTVKKEEEFVMVTKDEGGAEEEEDVVVVMVNEMEADEKDYVTIDKFQRCR